MFHLLMVILLSIGAYGSFVVWDYPMSSCPQGWTSEYWGFNSMYGAYLIISASEPFSQAHGEMTSGADTVFIPENCDSIAFHADQELYMTAYGTAGTFIDIRYRYDDNWHTVYTRSGNFSSQSPVNLSIPVSPGGTLFMSFSGETLVGSSGSGSIAWSLSDVTMTLYGDGVFFSQNSWAEIKSAF